MNDVSHAQKKPVSIVAVDTGQEASALRSVFEWFGYRVDVIWVGSREEFMKIISGNIETNDLVVLSVHGVEDGIAIPDGKAVTSDELAESAELHGKTVLNLGCNTGSDIYVSTFQQAGVEYYIAPDDYPEGNATLLFAIHFCYRLQQGMSVPEAAEEARSYSEKSESFQLASAD